MGKQIMAIVNPASSNGKTGRRWPELNRLMQEKGLVYDFLLTKGPGDAAKIACHALEEGYRTILSVGGDGTLNEIINGIFQAGDELRKLVTVGVISMGTGGDFVRTLQIPKDLNKAIDCISKGKKRRIDLGIASFLKPNGEKTFRYFCNIADIGLGGDTAARVNRTSKVFGGFISFLYSTILSLLLYKNKEITAVIDEKVERKSKITTLVIANGQYFGGGMKIAPLAQPDDALFDILFLHDMSKTKLLFNLFKVYKGKHLSVKGVELMRGEKVVITSPDVALVELDGEQPGRAPLEIQILPGSMQFFV
jgi:diacylglycerol kinase (ATP)